MRTLLLSSLLVSATAFGQGYAPPPVVPSQPPVVASQPPTAAPSSAGYAAADDGPGNGFQMDLGLLSAGGFYDLLSGLATGVGNGSGALGTGFLSQSSIDVGYQWSGNALLLNVGFGAFTNSNFLFEIGPTFRHYFTPLQTGHFSTFAEGSVGFIILAPNGGSSTFGIGFDGGLGGEWLFVKNFGLFAKATLGYAHAGSGGFNVDAIGLNGTAGLTLHL